MKICPIIRDGDLRNAYAISVHHIYAFAVGLEEVEARE